MVSEPARPIGVLVNNAANDDRHEIDDVTEEYWDSSLDINLKPQFFAAQAVRPHDEANWAAARSSTSPPSPGAAAPKTWPSTPPPRPPSIGLTRALGRGFGNDNIRVNAIEPGAVITERQKRLWFPDQEAIDAVVARQVV